MVIRRKLFAYTVMLAAGISAGFFIFERARLISGSLFLITLAIIVCLGASGVFIGSHGKSIEQAVAFKDTRFTRLSRTAITLLIAVAAGFMLFTVRYLVYGTCLNVDPDILREGEKIGIEGFTESITVKDGRMRITLGDTNITKYGIKVLVSMRANNGTERGYEQSENKDAIVNLENQANQNAAETGNDSAEPRLIGRRVRAYGVLQEPSSADNPGCFDYRVYLKSRGVGYVMYADSIDIGTDKALSAETVTETNTATEVDAGNAAAGNAASRTFTEMRATSESRDRMVSGSYLGTLYNAREHYLDRFADDEVRGFIKGAVFGDKSDISEEVIEEFNINGTGHILAVSGLHTGFLYSLLKLITRKRRSVFNTFLVIAVLIVYGDMTMWSPSAERAIIVLSLSMMSVYVGRPFDLLSAVSAAALVILIKEPYQLFNTGFQMSFLALLGISFMAKPLATLIGEALAVPIAVQAGIFPITAFVFHRINLLSILINIPIIFLASILVPLCMSAFMLDVAGGILMIDTATGSAGELSGSGTMLNHTAAMFANNMDSSFDRSIIGSVLDKVIEGLTDIVIRLNSIMTADGYFSGTIVSAGAGVILLIYLIIILASSEWLRIRILRHEYRMIAAAAGVVIIVSAAMFAASYNVFTDDEVIFVSVGQGDCTHIRAGGKDVLIDGGGSIERNIGKDVLMPYLLANGAENAEMCLVTHLHTDHYKGIYELNEVYPVGKVGIPENYRKSVENNRRINTGGDEVPENIMYVREGERISLTGKVFIQPIWPLKGSRGDIEIDDPNENNMVYIVNYDGVKIMVTGDLLEEDELEMVRHYQGTGVLKCDVLKVGHHGSKTSTSEAFLEAVSPEIAVISVGKNNMYGHPHAQTLERLEERGIEVYRTDLSGAVGIDVRRNSITVDVMKR